MYSNSIFHTQNLADFPRCTTFKAAILLGLAGLPNAAQAEILQVEFDLGATVSTAQGASDIAPSQSVDFGSGDPQSEVGTSNVRSLIVQDEPSAEDSVPRVGARVESKKTPWEKARPLEIVYQALNVVDGLETIYCIEKQRCVETNPILGKRPSPGKIIATKAITGVTHYFAARWIADNRPKWLLPFEYISIGIQGTVVALNLRHCF